MSKSHSWPRKPRVGDRVSLNDNGLEQCFNTTLGLSHMKTKIYILTDVDAESMTSPEDTWPVEVDDPGLNMLLIDQWCFDPVDL